MIKVIIRLPFQQATMLLSPANCAAVNPEEFQWAIAQLDDYEGLNVEPGEKPGTKEKL
jgi:hypothetical protein